MHKIGYFIVFLVAASCSSPDTQTDDASGSATPAADPVVAPCASAEDVLTGDGIGALRIGSSVEEIARACAILADTTEMDNEGGDQRVVYVQVGSDTVRSEVVADSVWRLTVERPVWKTEEGVGVGTRIGRLLEWPEPRGLVGEGNLVVVSPRHCGLSFEVSASPYGDGLGASGWDAAALRQLPDTVRVTTVYVFGCDPPPLR